ncbi:MAG: matrixin family metalloprotease [Bifidobacteriaceae bacterium]|jgi:hypothetical protein|nr:matrixin family metalloprotease [Bifidobacteriaceae bacterium]
MQIKKTLAILALAGIAIPTSVLASTADAAKTPQPCTSTVEFEELDTYDQVQCATTTDFVVFDDNITMALPEPGEWVQGFFDALEPLDSVEVAVFQSADGEIAAVLNGEANGTPQALSALSESDVASDIVEMIGNENHPQPVVPVPATTAVDGSPANKCSDSAQYVAAASRLIGDVNYYYNTAGQPSNFTSANHRARIEAAADAWELFDNSCNLDVGLPNLYTYYIGQTSQSPGMNATSCITQPSVNTFGWGAWGTASGVLGATCRWSNTRFAIAFNSSFTWYSGISETACSGSAWDLGAVAVHEWGHALGLGHYNSYNQVMNSAARGHCATFDRRIGRGDLRGIRELYGML